MEIASDEEATVLQFHQEAFGYFHFYKGGCNGKAQG
jgi:hypothetical protein